MIVTDKTPMVASIFWRDKTPEVHSERGFCFCVRYNWRWFDLFLGHGGNIHWRWTSQILPASDVAENTDKAAAPILQHSWGRTSRDQSPILPFVWTLFCSSCAIEFVSINLIPIGTNRAWNGEWSIMKDHYYRLISICVTLVLLKWQYPSVQMA